MATVATIGAVIVWALVLLGAFGIADRVVNRIHQRKKLAGDAPHSTEG